MAFYFFFMQGEKTTWQLALSTERQRVIAEKKPMYVTALDVDNSFTEDLTAADTYGIRYSGDLYFDFDGDIGDTLNDVKALLSGLKAKGVDLDSLRLYLTGGRGVHIEVPASTYMSVAQKNGVIGLPLIYKEMANALFVETLDLRVYSSGRGRMWRCTHVLRDNGRYKVPVTVEELFSVTPDTYVAMCSAPRAEPPRNPASLNAELALLYSISKDKVEKAIQKRKQRKVVADPLKPFNGQWPETLLLILNNVGLVEGVGWASIALQLAITAVALGKDEDTLIKDADPIINGHVGDSDKYGSPSARRHDLRRRYRHAHDSVTYEFSVGAVVSLIKPELRCNLDIKTDNEWQVDAPAAPSKTSTPKPAAPVKTAATAPVSTDQSVAAPAPKEPEPAPVEEPDPEGTHDDQLDDKAPVRISKYGIYVRDDDAFKRVSQIGMGKITMLKRLDGSNIGYEIEVFNNSDPEGMHLLTMDKFSSRASFQTWTMQWSASMTSSDIQASRLADVLGARVKKRKSTTYVTQREGVDIIVPPDAKSPNDYELVWASQDTVLTLGTKNNYRFRPAMAQESQFKTDLMMAPPLEVSDERLIHSLLHMNTTGNLAKMLGWFSAAFMCQIFRRFYARQFPSLQVFGQAGAGKSKSVAACAHLHYYLRDPKIFQSVGQTQFPILAAVASSASQVVIFEELKPREMNKANRDFMHSILRCNYDATDIMRGGISRDTAARDTIVNTFGNAGPVVFVGEALAAQSALLERCVLVAVSKTDRYGKDELYQYVESHATDLGRLGKAMVMNVLAMDVMKFREEFAETVAKVKVAAGPMGESQSRPVFNLAVALTGLKLLKQTLSQTFGDKFDERLDAMRDNILANVQDNIPNNLCEAARVLDVMSQLTRSADPEYQLVDGVDYTISPDGKTIDLKLRTAYTKYVKWQRSLGMEVLFDNENAFIAGMQNYGGTLRRSCPENEALHDSVRAVVYRLNAEYMAEEKIDSFGKKQ